ncbi:OmpA family protein [Flavobacterium sp. J27]|uniref:OmpA family protein n=1 Tax=Flavobacterium sp. J27 TaxID=2060419 RepID=UPI00102F6A59|nr:OmpA family protein [Flavobacterium sp. J27]
MKTIILTLICSLFITNTQAQFFKKLSEKAEKAAERTVERKVEKESSKKTNQAIDSVFGTAKTKKEKKTKNSDKNSGNRTNKKTNQEIVTGSSFFPNGTIIFEETFKEDAKGDFPANWETTGGGEIITVKDEKAFRFYPNSLCIAKTNKLPENYALEFDLITENLAYKELSGSEFRVQFTNENKLNKDLKQRAEFHFSLWQGSATADKIHVENFGTENKINNNINYKMNAIFNKTAHFTVVVNGKRLRLYIDNEKVIDLPSFLQNNVGRYIQFYLRGTKQEESHILAIANMKITEEGEDIRSLILKGGFHTTKIVFDSGSDKIKTESFAYLDKIGKVLAEDKNIRLKIIGHTDSDGDSKTNLVLSQKRAQAVQNYFIQHFSINEKALQTDGKGENEPVADNKTAEGKAENRRVEFKKI